MDSELIECVADYDYAYVMLSSDRSDTTQVILSKKKLSSPDVIELMHKNKADIGCDVYLTNRGISNWTPLTFYSGVLIDFNLKAKKN